MKIEIFYDKECPFCKRYANYIRLKEQYEVTLMNARESIAELQKLKAMGYDINDGLIVRTSEHEVYQGANAILFLNELSKKRFVFIENAFFKHFVYAVLKQLRKWVLFFKQKDSNIKL